MNGPLLSFLIFLPIVASVLVAILPDQQKLQRAITMGVSLLQLVIITIIYFGFQSVSGSYKLENFQFVEQQNWFELSLSGLGKISADYLVGIDGLGLIMVLLSVVVLLIATISSWHHKDRSRGYFALFLLLNGAIIGCFVALDFLLFYLFFEFMLLPMYFLIGLWGGPRREYASIKFFLYTLLGSVFILIVLIALNLSTMDPIKTAVEVGVIDHVDQYDEQIESTIQSMLASSEISDEQMVHTFNLVYMADESNLIPNSLLDSKVIKVILGHPARLLVFLLIFIGFAIKIPVVPFHTWLPDAHVEAPTAISVILAGILLKVGGYGLIRAGILIFPDGLIHYSWLLGMLGVLSIIYGAMNALASKDLKRLIAYSSVSHMGFVLLGIASISSEGFGGAIYQMISHGVISAALFLIAGVLYDRTHDRMIENYSGLAQQMPKYTVFVVIFFFASLGLPGFSGFIAEVFVLLGSFSSEYLPGWMMITATFGLVLSAAYYLWTIQRMFYGPLHIKVPIKEALLDIGKREYIMMVSLAILTFLLGVFPHFILDVINHPIVTFIELIHSVNVEHLTN